MDAKNVIRIASDSARNIFRLSFGGDIGVEEMSRAGQTIAEAMVAVRPGFYLLTDLSRLNSMDVQCMPYIASTMELASNHGIARVVRIIPDRSKDIGFNIMSLFHYPHGLPIITCEDEAEADRALR